MPRTRPPYPPEFRAEALKLARSSDKPLDPRQLEQQGEGDQPQDRIVQALIEHVAELGSDRS